MAETVVYTRTGDKGTTGLLDGTRIKKNHIRVETYGTVDELNSVLGFAKHYVDSCPMYDRIEIIQKELFWVAAELADPSGAAFESRLTEEMITRFEGWIDEIVQSLNPEPHFIVPGTSKASGMLHIARTVARRTERLIITLAEKEDVNALVLKYINRLSDVLYIFARQQEECQNIIKVSE